MNKRILFLSILGAFLLSACGEKIYTVDEFKKDEKLLTEYIKKCNNGELHPSDLNCINANKVRLDKVKNNHTINVR